VCDGAPDEESFQSDYNLVWNGTAARMPLVVLGCWREAFRDIKAVRLTGTRAARPFAGDGDAVDLIVNVAVHDDELPDGSLGADAQAAVEKSLTVTDFGEGNCS
jgi:hypothetical protein